MRSSVCELTKGEGKKKVGAAVSGLSWKRACDGDLRKEKREGLRKENTVKKNC